MNLRPLSYFRKCALISVFMAVWAGCASKPATSSSFSTPALPQGRAVPTPPPAALMSKDPKRVTIAVVGINDFHGHVIPKERKLPDGRIIQSGGSPVLTAMLKILREETKGNLLLVDAGDEWQGTLESNQVTGSIVLDYYRRIGMSVGTLGNHEFDFGIETLKNQVKNAAYPYVSANIFEKKTGKRIGHSNGFENLYPSRLFTVGGIKIGVVGAATQETPRTTRYDVVKPYDFRNPKPYVEEESASLRRQGANAVLLTTHAGTRCEKSEELNDWRVWTRDTPQGKCNPDAEVNDYFHKLKPGTVDGAILGHTHQIVHHWINGIPSIEDEAFNQFFNILYLTFDRATGKLLPSETRIEGLIPVCAEFFENVDHCDARRLPDGYSPGLRPAYFHGKKVVPDPDTLEWLRPIVKSTEHYRKEVIATAAAPILHPPYTESMFGNLVSDVLKERGHTDFALVNERGIRTSLEAGPITADALYRALPFDNLLNIVTLKGKDVKLLFRISTSGGHQIWSSAGLRIKIIPFEKPAPKTDLNGNGKLENWETNRVVEITKLDGTPIDDEKEYTVATFDYLVSGGDNMAWFMSRVPKSKIKPSEAGYCRELVADYLRKKKVINTPEEPLLDPKRPRLILVP